MNAAEPGRNAAPDALEPAFECRVSLGSSSKLLLPKAGQVVEVAYWGLPGTPRVQVKFK